jgi:hypothetical protein
MGRWIAPPARLDQRRCAGAGALLPGVAPGVIDVPPPAGGGVVAAPLPALASGVTVPARGVAACGVVALPPGMVAPGMVAPGVVALAPGRAAVVPGVVVVLCAKAGAAIRTAAVARTGKRMAFLLGDWVHPKKRRAMRRCPRMTTTAPY